ncbi:MAG TPA: hypothetical protein VFF67_01290 [Thermoplasmata archaeon]|nr:hypothetical protein [Thermoplasmata archaeon]
MPTTNPPNAPPRRTDAIDRELLRFLATQVEPTVARQHHPRLLAALREVIREGNVDGLAGLPERFRRELLVTVDERIADPRRSPSPRAVVRLANAISGAPPVDPTIDRLLATPAR